MNETNQVTETGLNINPGLIITMGILSMLAGVLAMGAPLAAGTAAMMFIGAAVLIGGLFELVGAFRAEGWKAGIFAFLGGLLAVVCGLMVLGRPLVGLAVLTLILIGFFLVDGIVRIILSFKVRPQAGWGLMLLGGLVTVLLGVMIWKQWPWSGVWAIGTLLGIRFLFSGGAMLALGLQVRKALH